MQTATSDIRTARSNLPIISVTVERVLPTSEIVIQTLALDGHMDPKLMSRNQELVGTVAQ